MKALRELFVTDHCQDENSFYVSDLKNVVKRHEGDGVIGGRLTLSQGECVFSYWLREDRKLVNINEDWQTHYSCQSFN